MDREKFITDNMNLVYFTINKYRPSFKKDEDIVQAGMVGLIRAVDKFDPNRGEFSTYAVKVILSEINEELRRRKNDSMTTSLDAILEKKGKHDD